MKTNSFILVTIVALTMCLTLPFETLKANPPRWAPAHGYRAKTHHVYFPEQNFYYDTHRNVYIYPDRGRWVTNGQLPSIFLGVNLFNAPKVELEINSDRPYVYNRKHIEMYKQKYKKEKKEFKRDYKDRRDYDENEHGNKHGNKHRR